MSGTAISASNSAPGAPARPRLILADPQALVTEALRTVLSPEFEVLDAVADGEALLASVSQQQPDLVLLELSLPHVDGLDAVRVLRARAPELRCLFVMYWLSVNKTGGWVDERRG